GRKVNVSMYGRSRYSLEKKGYAALTHLPPHPAGQADLALFLSDAHVKAVLDQWQIGWDAPEAETAYFNQSESTITSGSAIEYWGDGDQTDASGNLGTSPFNFGTVTYQSLKANSCFGGNTVPHMALRASRANSQHSGEDEWIITQICTPPNQSQWFGR